MATDVAALPDKTLKVVVAAGLASGIIDIGYAIAASGAKGVSADRVLQSVASGLLGRGAYDGGAATATLGLILHLAMTCVMALVFIVAAKSLEPVRRNLVIAGLIYGAAIYFAMRWVVVPLSHFPGDLRAIKPLELAVHMVGVGLVIALIARRAVPSTRDSAAFSGDPL